ncbi:MAG: type II toxin-antitoxin system VapC family toxin [Deltaproteobacteria bacterium]|nr:type II toxin-antitoxin system VapC family toxin [Deltaproteobacteria bacterium]
MILIDANLLIYAHVSDFPQHSSARSWLDRTIEIEPRVGMPWVSLLAFVRIVTNPRVFPNSESVADAWEQVRAWLRASSVWIPQPTERHEQVLDGLIRSVGRSSLVPDAHLAALAIEHGLLLCSCDGDFARFPGLRWENPIL